jgi:hypothetical protein
VLHGSKGEIKLTQTIAVTLETAENREISQFMRGLRKMLIHGGRIDILGCDVAASPEGKQLIAKLEQLYGINFAASDDVTAVAKGAGDMQLETDGVDLIAVRTRSHKRYSPSAN